MLAGPALLSPEHILGVGMEWLQQREEEIRAEYEDKQAVAAAREQELKQERDAWRDRAESDQRAVYQAIARATDAETQLGRTVQVASQRESDLLAQIADVAPAAVPLVDDHEKVVHGFRVTLASKDSALASQGELVVSLRGELGKTQELHELTKGRLELANWRVDYLEGAAFPDSAGADRRSRAAAHRL